MSNQLYPGMSSCLGEGIRLVGLAGGDQLALQRRYGAIVAGSVLVYAAWRVSIWRTCPTTVN